MSIVLRGNANHADVVSSIPFHGEVYSLQHYVIITHKGGQWLATGLWFSPRTLVSSTNKTYCHDITEILLKVALNTITLTLINKWKKNMIVGLKILCWEGTLSCSTCMIAIIIHPYISIPSLIVPVQSWKCYCFQSRVKYIKCTIIQINHGFFSVVP